MKTILLHVVPLLLSFLFFISATTLTNIKSSIVVSNKINSTHLLFQTYNLHEGTQGPSTYFPLANKTNAFVMTFLSPSFYFENPQTYVTEFAAASLSKTRVFALQHQDPDFQLANSAALQIDETANKIYSLGGNQIGTHRITIEKQKKHKFLEVMKLGGAAHGEAANGDVAFVYSIDRNTGDVVKEFEMPETEILVGSFALDTKEQVMYYSLGPQNSYALVTQRYDSGKPGKVVSIHTIQGEVRGETIATNLFYCNKTGELFATLFFEDDSSALVWMETPEAGSYRILLDFGKELHSEEGGKVMQRMIAYDSHKQVLYGWFASGSGSTSKLFAASVSPREAHILAAVDYQEQVGNWRGIGFFY